MCTCIIAIPNNESATATNFKIYSKYLSQFGKYTLTQCNKIYNQYKNLYNKI